MIAVMTRRQEDVLPGSSGQHSHASLVSLLALPQPLHTRCLDQRIARLFELLTFASEARLP